MKKEKTKQKTFIFGLITVLVAILGISSRTFIIFSGMLIMALSITKFMQKTLKNLELKLSRRNSKWEQ
jgi:hypothetical protein